MAAPQQTFLDSESVKRVALPLLQRRLAPFHFTDVDVVEEEDFDGELVLRMTANVSTKVPAQDLITVTADIHDALRKEGDERFVYLGTRRPTNDLADEPEE